MFTESGTSWNFGEILGLFALTTLGRHVYCNVGTETSLEHSVKYWLPIISRSLRLHRFSSQRCSSRDSQSERKWCSKSWGITWDISKYSSLGIFRSPSRRACLGPSWRRPCSQSRKWFGRIRTSWFWRRNSRKSRNTRSLQWSRRKGRLSIATCVNI